MFTLRYECMQLSVEHLALNIPDLGIEQIADNLHDQLLECQVGTRPVVFVCYSMGGVVAKALLSRHSESTITKNTRGVMFIATPHFGSDVIRDTVAFIRPIIVGPSSFLAVASDSMKGDELMD